MKPIHNFIDRKALFESELEGRDCFAALDLSRTRDTSALVLLFRMDDGTLRFISRFWLPRKTAEKQKDRISWFAWEHAGAITLCETPSQDFGLIWDELEHLSQRFNFVEIAFDPWGSADLFTQQVEEKLGIPRIKFLQRQEYFTVAVEEVERRVLEQTLLHDGNPVMDWQISNVEMRIRGQEKKPVREKKDDAFKIDGPVSLLMTVARHLASENESDEEPSCRLL